MKNEIPDDVIIRAENLGKCYRIYNSPKDRLKQALLRTSASITESFGQSET